MLVGGPNWSLIDGSANAPTGTPQFPTVLNSYAARPPWKVAGVDYRVGINTGVSLISPTAHPQLSVSGNTATVTVANAVINGVDFTDYAILIQTDNVTVSNCKFFISPGNPSSIVDVWSGAAGGTNQSVSYCDFDFTNFSSNSRAAMVNSISDGFTAVYNRMFNTYSDNFSVNGGTSTLKYNLFNQTISFQSMAHPDWWQMGGSGGQLIAQFNTGVMNLPGTSNVQGAQCFYIANGTSWVSPSDAGWNTFTGVGTPNGDALGGSYIGMFGDDGLTTYNVHDNYIDPLWCRTGTVFHDLIGINATGNINMNTGASENS